jgi:hypothetical protein
MAQTMAPHVAAAYSSTEAAILELAESQREAIAAAHGAEAPPTSWDPALDPSSAEPATACYIDALYQTPVPAGASPATRSLMLLKGDETFELLGGFAARTDGDAALPLTAPGTGPAGG